MSNGFRILWRLAVIAVCAIFLISSAVYVIESTAEWLEWKNRGQDMEGYDYYLYDGEYMRLKDRLGSYGPRDEKFQIYWDVADAYECFSVHEFWQLALQNGQLSGEYAEEYRQRLLEIYDGSSDTARTYIRSFAGDLIDRTK